MLNDKELLQQTFDFFSQYIKINEIGQDELQAEAEIILNSIQTRLAQAEKQEPVLRVSQKTCQVCGISNAGIHYCTGKKQAEKQEPVAWFMEGTYKDGTPSFVQVNGETDPEFYTPLYTAPPQREWVGLTDKVKLFFIKNSPNLTTIQLIEAVEEELRLNHYYYFKNEKKLKEKNGMD